MNSSTEYLKKVVMTLIGSACGIVGIAGGYYTLYRIVTLLGNT